MFEMKNSRNILCWINK